MSLSGHAVAAGAEGAVLFWDRRTHKPCGSFADTHAQDVTQVDARRAACPRFVLHVLTNPLATC